MNRSSLLRTKLNFPLIAFLPSPPFENLARIRRPSSSYPILETRQWLQSHAGRARRNLASARAAGRFHLLIRARVARTDG
jgi:hypothetical protein